MSKSPELYDYLLQDIWQLTVCVILGYLVASAFFTVLLYPAYVWDPENSFSGEPPGTLGMGAAVFCMSLCALSQTAVNLTDLAPTSGYTISVVVLEHFVGACPFRVVLPTSLPRKNGSAILYSVDTP